MAQGAAARAAIQVATTGLPIDRREEAVIAESAREHAFALLRAAPSALLARVRGAVDDRPRLLALLETDLLGVSAGRWLGIRDEAGLLEWATETTAPLARDYLIRLSLTEPRGPAMTSDPAAKPSDDESGAYSRQWQRPLVAAMRSRPLLQHWLARLIETVLYATDDAETPCGELYATAVGPGNAHSIISTARGLLRHEVVIEDGIVRDYSIVAPTDVHFAANGPAHRWLAGAASASAAQSRQFAEQVVAALDPCVDYRITSL